MLTAIVDGELYTPEPLGRGSLLYGAGRILKVGDVDVQAIRSTGLDVEVIDAAGHIVTPGLIDPHEHLIGGGGERGFATQTPEISFGELVQAGITTVVGCLGADTTTRTMEGLLGRAKALDQQHLTALVWTGGYDVPPVTLTGTVTRDMILIQEVIGCGELAISDGRSSMPSFRQLARLVKQTRTAGTLTGKCGVTHFHLGDEPEGLAPIRRLLDEGNVDPNSVYPTHVSRNERLVKEAAELTTRGVTVDMDTVDRDLPERLQYFLECGGLTERLTISSDASISGPHNLIAELRRCVTEGLLDLTNALRLATLNTARILHLHRKGRLKAGSDADVLLLRADDLSLQGVVSGGVQLMSEGSLIQSEPWTEESDRRIELHGRK